MRTNYWMIAALSASFVAFAACSAGDEADASASTPDTSDAGNASSPTGSADGGAPPSRLYATFVTHNELSNNAPCKAVVTEQAEYLANRAATIAYAKTIVEGGGAYDMQSDMDYLDQIDAHDTADVTATTEGKNLVRYLAELSPSRLVVDAHSHEKAGVGGFNIADVAKKIQDLGAPDTGVVGGFIANPASEEDWTRFRAPVTGTRTAYSWTAKVLWGGASGLHKEDVGATGVWHPKSPDEFFIDDPTANLPVIGTYAVATDSENGSQYTVLDGLLTQLKSGALPAGRMYTVTLMNLQCDLHRDATLTSKAKEFLAAHTEDVQSGVLVFATLPEVERVFREEYGSRGAVTVRE